jgi:hypothetical protein
LACIQENCPRRGRIRRSVPSARPGSEHRRAPAVDDQPRLLVSTPRTAASCASMVVATQLSRLANGRIDDLLLGGILLLATGLLVLQLALQSGPMGARSLALWPSAATVLFFAGRQRTQASSRRAPRAWRSHASRLRRRAGPGEGPGKGPGTSRVLYHRPARLGA